MPNALTRRLEEYVPLTGADKAELARLTSQPTHTVSARRDLLREGDAPRSLYLILKAGAVIIGRWRNGRRQICDFPFLAIFAISPFILDRMDHSIGAITRVKVAEISREVFFRVATTSRDITTALWWQELVSKSIHREWIVNVAQRTAQERIAHLFCEMFLRLESVGLTDGFTCDFAPTQLGTAEATGLTPVHVNRSIQELRRRGLVILERTKLTISNMLALQTASLFNPEYLHHRRLNRHTDYCRDAQSRLNGTVG